MRSKSVPFRPPGRGLRTFTLWIRAAVVKSIARGNWMEKTLRFYFLLCAKLKMEQRSDYIGSFFVMRSRSAGSTWLCDTPLRVARSSARLRVLVLGSCVFDAGKTSHRISVFVNIKINCDAWASALHCQSECTFQNLKYT